LISTRAALNAQLVDGLQGAADLIALGQAEAHAARIQTLNDELIQAQRRMASIGAWQNSLGTLLTNLAMGAIVMCAIPLVTRAKLSGVDLAVLALATLASFEGVLAVPGAFQYLETHLQAARRLFEMIDVPAPQTRGRFVEIPRLAGSGVSVRIEHLSFRYCAAEPLVLDRVSFEAQPGQLIAIAGPSGAGKSTLINLLLRFWDYIDGSIQLNGVDLRECDPEAVRKLIGVVPQQTHLFNATIRENLRLARPDASDEAMVHAAQLAQLHDFIQSLPQGYDTPIGEQGLRLSGGERQRLAIARAVLKDAPLLILDEATAHLDLATERDLLRGLRPFLAQRTTLMITHRPIGLEDAHAIIVLKQGRVVERKRRT
jgi:ATP-binding cassette subfamily C protein CydC